MALSSAMMYRIPIPLLQLTSHALGALCLLEPKHQAQTHYLPLEHMGPPQQCFPRLILSPLPPMTQWEVPTGTGSPITPLGLLTVQQLTYTHVIGDREALTVQAGCVGTSTTEPQDTEQDAQSH